MPANIETLWNPVVGGVKEADSMEKRVVKSRAIKD